MLDRPPTCPRCGYDLSGIVASWERSCPVEGVCSECGLGFPWARVCRAEFQHPRWYVEGSGGRFARRCTATFLWSLAPWVLWREVSLWHAVRPGALARYAALSVLAGHILFALAAFAAWNAWAVLPAPAGGPAPALEWLPLVWPYSEFNSDAVAALALFGSAPLVWVCLVPAFMFLFSDTLRIEPVRLPHLVRIGILSVPVTFAAVLAFLAAIQLVPANEVAGITVVVVFFYWLLWVATYWICAAWMYLRLRAPVLAIFILAPAAFAVTFVLMIGASLVANELGFDF